MGEGATIQVLVKPAPKSFKKAAASFIYQLKKTASPELKADLETVLLQLTDGSLQREFGYMVR